jgi:hypothetical protein
MNSDELIIRPAKNIVFLAGLFDGRFLCCRSMHRHRVADTIPSTPSPAYSEDSETASATASGQPAAQWWTSALQHHRIILRHIMTSLKNQTF